MIAKLNYIEPLNPLRASIFTEPEEVAKLVVILNALSVFGLAIDAGHLFR